jgi:two-component system sensor histidine kinase KdpD
MPNSGRQRPTPEELLKQVEAEERAHLRGKLKVFLGYASGVGKSFRMLDEGRRRKARGEDVVVAAVQDAGEEVAQLLAHLEQIPLRTDLKTPVVDVEAVKRRKPSLCLIDGLAYKNSEGSKNADRWQDVEELLSAGISVLTTINLQYIRERQPEVEAIRGKRAVDSVPESFLHRADEIEIVDAPPGYCVTRVQTHDANTPVDSVEIEHQLSRLREIALVLTAEVVDHQLQEYLRRKGIDQTYGTHERILVCVTPRSNASLMIRRGKRQADRFHGDLHVAYVEHGDLTQEDRRMLELNFDAARKAGALVEILQGEDPIAAIVRHATSIGITQIFVGHSLRTGWLDRIKPNPIERLILESKGMDVRIFPHEEASA